MRIESVEIYSDQTNAAVLRHTGRAFPGVLMQGDSLLTLCVWADLACEKVEQGAPGRYEVDFLRKALRGYLDHYKAVLGEHKIKLPFSEQQPSQLESCG